MEAATLGVVSREVVALTVVVTGVVRVEKVEADTWRRWNCP
jgi:hypothetical protein